MKVERFEDLLVWQKSREFSKEIYRVFESQKDYSFRDQIRRAAVSITNNIAEGFERKGNKEFSKFIFISKGSSAEVRSMLYLALDLRYISETEFNKLYSQTVEISRLLHGLVKSLKY